MTSKSQMSSQARTELPISIPLDAMMKDLANPNQAPWAFYVGHGAPTQPSGAGHSDGLAGLIITTT